MVKVMKSRRTAKAHGLNPSIKPAAITMGSVNVCGSIAISFPSSNYESSVHAGILTSSAAYIAVPVIFAFLHWREGDNFLTFGLNSNIQVDQS